MLGLVSCLEGIELGKDTNGLYVSIPAHDSEEICMAQEMNAPFHFVMGMHALTPLEGQQSNTNSCTEPLLVRLPDSLPKAFVFFLFVCPIYVYKSVLPNFGGGAIPIVFLCFIILRSLKVCCCWSRYQQDKSCSKEMFTDYLRMSIEVGKIAVLESIIWR